MAAQTTNEDLPARIGRYDVVFPLASRVGASLVVGRLNEPESSPVTIMRIAPEVTQGRDVERFLFSVREALGVRHPNVAAIRELRNEGGEIYLVMEHLQGETAAALIHRLDVEGRALDFGLGAHIAAEAAAALDAGHELGVLHEHLTPHDIFIGYDGSVKVLDLGIARPLAELMDVPTIDERDLPYASPERCKGDALDRRSDVYSLGTILWELMSGSSPFERMSHADTLRAILTEEPTVPPTKVLRSLPTDLSNIALRALARDRAKRPATARALGEELRTFVRSVPMGGAQPSATLAMLMQSLFAKRIKNNSRLLRRFELASIAKAPLAVATAADVSSSRVADESDLERPTVDEFQPTPLPVQARPEPAPVASERDIPVAPTVTAVREVGLELEPPHAAPEESSPPPPSGEPVEPLLTEVFLGEPVAPEPAVTKPAAPKPALPQPDVAERTLARPDVAKPAVAKPAVAEPAVEEPPLMMVPAATRGRRVAVWMLVGLVLVAGVVTVVLRPRQGNESPIATTLSPPASPQSVEPSPTPSLPATASVAPSNRAAPSSSAAREEATATIHIETMPPKAMILVAGKTMGVSPIDLRLPRGRQPVRVEARYPGYQIGKETIVPDGDQRLKLNLSVLQTPSNPNPNPYHRFE